jgi:SnoaL-like polyketide cyclase
VPSGIGFGDDEYFNSSKNKVLLLPMFDSKIILPTVMASLLFMQTMTVYATTSPPQTYMPNALDREPPTDSLIEVYNWSHELWNAQNLSQFIPFFYPIFYYVDHPTGHQVYNQPQMRTYAGALWNFSSDPKMVDREYLKDNSSGMILMTGIMNGTHDESFVVPATGKVFEVPLAEFILWDENKRVLGGDMYYDRLNLLEDIGMANWTAPETPTPTRMESPPPAMLPPGPASGPSDDLRQRHNWLHEQWNERNISAVLPYIEPEIHYVDQATGQVLTTAEELANHISRPLNASSDAKIANYEYFQSGDQTFSKFTLYGTNDQPYEDNPATGNNFSVDAVEIVDWDSEGKVKGGEIFYDRLTALEQIG